jgi:enamine deaminase RidA (YjgF/YER057c/UK114 family)
MPREAFSSDQIAAPVGPFSPGVRVGELLFLSAPYPARTTVAVSALPLGAAVEIDLIAR